MAFDFGAAEVKCSVGWDVGWLEVMFIEDWRGGTVIRFDGGVNSEVGLVKSLSISLDSSVFTTEDLPPPNSLVELVLGPDERTLSRSNPASAGSEDLLFGSLYVFSACFLDSFWRSLGEDNPDALADLTSFLTCLTASMPDFPMRFFMDAFAP